jgi:hypothetical protein
MAIQKRSVMDGHRIDAMRLLTWSCLLISFRQVIALEYWC